MKPTFAAIGLSALALSGLLERAHAFPNGAGTCTASAGSITGMPTRARNAPGAGPYSVTVDMVSQTYTPGAEHMVAITSSGLSTFTGLLLYAETMTGQRVGVFDKSDSFVGSPVAACPGGSAGAASHTVQGPVAESTLMIPWTAPAQDVGPVTFRSIVLGGRRGDINNQAFFFPTGVTLAPAPTGGAEFEINQGIAGAWFNPGTAGQGFLIDIEPGGQFMFIAWFTYESADGKLGAPEHRWLTAQGGYEGSGADLSLFSTSGGAFDDPQATQTDPAGNLQIEFEDCSTGTIVYQVDDGGLEGTIPITRVIPGTEALCQEIADAAAR